MTTLPWRAAIAVAGAALAGAALTMALAAPVASAQPAGSAHGKPGTHGAGQPAASAHAKAGPAAGGTAKGDNGDVKIHNSTTAVTDQRNEPHVCVFYLDAFGFDAGQSVSWTIKSWPPTGSRTVVASGALALDSSGDGHTGDMTLQNGHYKLFWNFAGENGFAKQKVFWVACPAAAPSPTPTPSTPGSPPAKGKHKGVSVPSAPAPTPVRSNLPVTG
jgi:hypothetical protein